MLGHRELTSTCSVSSLVTSESKDGGQNDNSIEIFITKRLIKPQKDMGEHYKVSNIDIINQRHTLTRFEVHWIYSFSIN